MQTKKDSLRESIVDTVIGFLISFVLSYYVLPLYGLAQSIQNSVEVVAIFTIAGFVRKYVIRRIYNYKQYNQRKS